MKEIIELASALDFLGRQHFGHLITVCDRADALCPIFPGVSYRQHWPLSDPSEVEGTEEERLTAFRETRGELLFKISAWLMDQGITDSETVPRYGCDEDCSDEV
jgi:hypothetical protein